MPFQWRSNTRFHGNEETFRYIHNSSHQFFRMLLTSHSALSWQTGIYSSGKASTSWCDKLQATWPKLCQSCHVDHSSFSCTAVESSPPGTLTKCLIIYVVVRKRWMWRKTDVLIPGFILLMKLQAVLKELLSAWYIILKPFASHLLKCHSLSPYLRVWNFNRCTRWVSRPLWN